MTAPVAQVLRDAAELIERDGWRQGGSVGEDTVCIIDAIFAAGSRRGYQSIVDTVKAHLGVETALSAWNDAPGRTVTEVLAALRACADEQEASEEASPPPAENKVVDLMAALEASLADAKAARKRPRSESEEASDG